MKTIPKAALENCAAYESAPPKQLGNLHERMKYVLAEIEKAISDDAFAAKYQALYQGILDLRTEVAHYEPAKPPFGRRPSDARSGIIGQRSRG